MRIADGADAFVAAIDDALTCGHPSPLSEIDAHLAGTSWDRTWSRMLHLMTTAIAAKAAEPVRAAAQARPVARGVVTG